MLSQIATIDLATGTDKNVPVMSYIPSSRGDAFIIKEGMKRYNITVEDCWRFVLNRKGAKDIEHPSGQNVRIRIGDYVEHVSAESPFVQNVPEDKRKDALIQSAIFAWSMGKEKEMGALVGVTVYHNTSIMSYAVYYHYVEGMDVYIDTMRGLGGQYSGKAVRVQRDGGSKA